MIDASYVRWLGEHTLQVVRSAELTWEADGRVPTLANAPACFIEDLRCLGVEPQYR